MRGLEAPLVPICRPHMSFVGMVISDRHELSEHITRESAECALQDFIERGGTLCSSHIKNRLVGIVKEFDRCAVWGKNLINDKWEYHKGWCVTAEILGRANYHIWKNIVNGYFRGLSIGGFREGAHLTINEISLVNDPGYLGITHSLSAGGGE